MRAWILMLVTPAVFGQTSYTNCSSAMPNSIQCTTVQQPAIARPAPAAPQVIAPDVVRSYLAGQDLALWAKQMRSQPLEKPTANIDLQKLTEQQSAERLIRQRKALEQTEACIRLNSTKNIVDGDGVQKCVDLLKVSDPDYARAAAEMHEGNQFWLDAAKSLQHPKPAPMQ